MHFLSLSLHGTDALRSLDCLKCLHGGLRYLDVSNTHLMGLSGLESLKLLRVLDISIGCHCHGCASQPWDNGNHPLLSSPLFEGVESWVEKLLGHALAREEPCHIYHMNLPLLDSPLFTNSIFQEGFDPTYIDQTGIMD